MSRRSPRVYCSTDAFSTGSMVLMSMELLEAAAADTALGPMLLMLVILSFKFGRFELDF